jgi:hypothetical protein
VHECEKERSKRRREWFVCCPQKSHEYQELEAHIRQQIYLATKWKKHYTRDSMFLLGRCGGSIRSTAHLKFTNKP